MIYFLLSESLLTRRQILLLELSGRGNRKLRKNGQTIFDVHIYMMRIIMHIYTHTCSVNNRFVQVFLYVELLYDRSLP